MRRWDMSPLQKILETVGALAMEAGLTRAEFEEASGPLSATSAITRARAHRDGALLLLGPPGTGKTLASAHWLLGPFMRLENWMWRDWDWSFRPRYAPVWITAKALSRTSQYEADPLERLFSAPRLVLDDIGQEYLDKSGFLASAVDELVSERHRRRLATILTANLDAPQFEARYGKRVTDRIAATGGAEVCRGNSLRRTKAGKVEIEAAFTDAKVAARIAACDEELRIEHEKRDAEDRERARAFAASRSARQESVPVLDDKPMSEEEVKARKEFLRRQFEELQQRGGGQS